MKKDAAIPRKPRGRLPSEHVFAIDGREVRLTVTGIGPPNLPCR